MLRSLTLSRSLSLWLFFNLAFCASQMHAQIDYVDFRSTDRLSLVGTAVQSDSVIDLNGFEPKLAGGIWYAEKQQIARGFTTSFQFRVTDTSGQDDAAGAKGGDGFAFVIQNTEPAPLGGSGGMLGYDPIKNSLAIEFDTYHNDEPGFDDPNGNHVAIHTTGTGNNSASNSFSIASNTDIPNLSDGRVHTVTIVYLNGSLRLYLDGCQGLLLALSLDLERRIALDDGRAWVGFTASTGSAWERHVLHSWRFNARPKGTAMRVGLCAGGVARLTPPGRFNSYTWSTGASTPSINVTTPGRYSVEVTDTLGCSTTDATFVYEVVVSNPPRPQISQRDSIGLCIGDRITLDGGAYASWSWSTGETTRSITVAQPGIYGISVIDSLGCSGTDSITVVPLPVPAAPSIDVKGTLRFCSGDSTVLDAGPGFATYRWSNGATTRRITVRDAGSYTVVVANASGCTAKSQPVVITVHAKPYPVIQPLGNTRFCRGGNVTLDAGTGYTSYRWSNGATTPTITVDSSGSYKVVVTGTNGCVGTSASVDVIVYDRPAPEIITEPTAQLCQGDTVVLRTQLSYATYRWSNGSAAATLTVTESGVYTVSVVDDNGCEATSAPYYVSIDSIGVLRIAASGPTDMCAGSVVTLEVPDGLGSYRWSTGESTRSIEVATSGTFSVVGIDSAGCSASDSIIVRVFSQPLATVTADTTICAGTALNLVATGGEQFAWSPAEGLDCIDCANPRATPLHSTRYRVVVSNAGGCSDTAWTMVNVLPSPRLNVRVDGDRTVFPGQSVELPVTISVLPTDSIGEFTIDLWYGTSIAILRGIVLGSDMLDGWQFETLIDTSGLFRARFRSTDARVLRDGQTLLTMRLQTFIGVPLHATVTPVLTLVDRPCASITAVAGSITIDSLCGISSRLIESFGGTFALSPAAPNPFNPSTRISVALGFDAETKLEILTTVGERVSLLNDGLLAAGTHTFEWDASALPSGVYIARLTSGSRRDSQVLLLVK